MYYTQLKKNPLFSNNFLPCNKLSDITPGSAPNETVFLIDTDMSLAYYLHFRILINVVHFADVSPLGVRDDREKNYFIEILNKC